MKIAYKVPVVTRGARRRVREDAPDSQWPRAVSTILTITMTIASAR
jgi:hypothetical protein